MDNSACSCFLNNSMKLFTWFPIFQCASEVACLSCHTCGMQIYSCFFGWKAYSPNIALGECFTCYLLLHSLYCTYFYDCLLILGVKLPWTSYFGHAKSFIFLYHGTRRHLQPEDDVDIKYMCNFIVPSFLGGDCTPSSDMDNCHLSNFIMSLLRCINALHLMDISFQSGLSLRGSRLSCSSTLSGANVPFPSTGYKV